MTYTNIIFAAFLSIACTLFVYYITGFKDIISCYRLWLDKKYWTDYNVIEALSWTAKAIIIIPGLLFDMQIWWFYIFALITSMLLIWASNKKLLPTLVAFNTLWIVISAVVIAQNVME